jgi:hypothetical protein
MTSLYESGIIKSSPNAHCFTAAISSCGYCENDTIEKRDALKIFVETYNKLMNDVKVQPNHVTFATVLTTIRRLYPENDERVEIVKRVFNKCTASGMCNDGVIGRLQSLLRENDLKQLVGPDAVSPDGTVQFEMLPLEWKRNVGANARSRSARMIKNGPIMR